MRTRDVPNGRGYRAACVDRRGRGTDLAVRHTAAAPAAEMTVTSTLKDLTPGMPEYGFSAVPVHSVYLEDEWVSFCDNPLMKRVKPTGWEALLRSEPDRMCLDGHPLLMEVHP